MNVPAGNATADVPVGTVAYRPRGNALRPFRGPTPASTGDRPRAASPVNRAATLEAVSPPSALDGGADVRVEAL